MSKMRKNTQKYLKTSFEILLNFGIIAILSIALTGNYWYDIKGADLSDQGFGKDFKICQISRWRTRFWRWESNLYFGLERICLYMEGYFAVADRHWTQIVVKPRTVRLLKKSSVELSNDHWLLDEHSWSQLSLYILWFYCYRWESLINSCLAITLKLSKSVLESMLRQSNWSNI